MLLARQGLLAAPAVRPWREELTGPAGTLEAVQRLGALQLDPVAVVERCHQLALYARVKGYRTAWFDGLYEKGAVFEYLANARCALPMGALPDFWPIMLQIRANNAQKRESLGESVGEVLEAAQRQKHFRPRDVGNQGPRLLGVGYNAAHEESKASGLAIDLLWLGGQLFVSRREGAEKWYSLPKHVVPPFLLEGLIEPDELQAVEGGFARPWSTPIVRKGIGSWTDMLMGRYLEAFGLAETTDPRFGWQYLTAADRKAWLAEAAERGDVAPVRIEGVKRLYWAPASVAAMVAEVEAAPAAWEPEPEVRFLPPLDNLLWSRPRLVDLFGFEYVWEVYTPAAKRRYGAFTMPILEGDRLIGRIDPRMDRAQGRLVLQLVQLEPGVKPDRSRLARLAKALKGFAKFHGAAEIEVLRTEPENLKLSL